MEEPKTVALEAWWGIVTERDESLHHHVEMHIRDVRFFRDIAGRCPVRIKKFAGTKSFRPLNVACIGNKKNTKTLYFFQFFISTQFLKKKTDNRRLPTKPPIWQNI